MVLFLVRRLESSFKTRINMISSDLVSRLREFVENGARSCSMDFGCVTPEYVYRMWGGVIALNDIKAAMREVKLPM